MQNKYLVICYTIGSLIYAIVKLLKGNSIMFMISNNFNINIFWGKTAPYKSLINHMIDAGCTATALLSNGSLIPVSKYLAEAFNVPTDEIVKSIAYWAALHDIGKCHPAFQEMAKETVACKYIIQNDLGLKNKLPDFFRHEQYSARIVRRIFNSKGRTTRKTIKHISNIIGLHHQGKNGKAIEVISNQEWWFSAQNELEEILYQLFKPTMLDFDNCTHIDAVCMLIMGCVILSDWIASGNWFDNVKNDCDIEEYYKEMMYFVK